LKYPEEKKAMRRLLLIVFGLILLTSCSDGTALPPGEEDLATAVSATLASIDGGTPGGETAATEASATPEQPASPPEPAFTDWMVAFSDGESISVRIDGAPPIQVSNRGVILNLALSDDGRYIVYGRSDERGENYELRVVESDGSYDRVLLDEITLDALHVLDIALHIRPSQMAFIPSTHRLLLNTRAVFEGPGLAKSDDLLQLNVESGSLVELLEPGQGGDFYLAPNARRMALVKPSSISLADEDGSNRQPDVITFEPVITYSEYAYYPVPRWAPNSSRIGVVIPSADPLAPNPTAAVWIAPADGGAAEQMAVISGEVFFAQAFGTPLISPELLDMVLFLKAGTSNEQGLYLARVDGSGKQLYVTGNLAWAGWNPDSIRFAYRVQPDQYYVGSKGANPQSLGQGRRLEWIDPDEYLLLSGQSGSWQLNMAAIGQGSVQIASSNDDSLLYAFIH
jgi:hypothetical protein